MVFIYAEKSSALYTYTGPFPTLIRMYELAVLACGLGLVAYGAKLALDNAVLIANHYNVPDFYIGVAILAIGSDLPELVVTIDAAIKNAGGLDTSGIIVGNALGSCFGQLGLTLGLVGCLSTLTMPRRYLQRQSIALLASLVVLGAAGWDGSVSRSEGILLVAAFAAYLTAMLRSTPPIDERLPRPEVPLVRTWSQLAAGLLIVVVAAELIVVSAVTLAEQWAVPQSFIAIVLVMSQGRFAEARLRKSE